MLRGHLTPGLPWAAFELALWSQGIDLVAVRGQRAWIQDQYYQVNSDNGLNADYRPDWHCGQPGMDQITTVGQALQQLQGTATDSSAWPGVLLKTYYLMGGRCDDDRWESVAK
jgi:hypothetical protein